MKPTTPLRAIRLKCLDCSCENAAEVKRCHIEDCALWSFRMGRNPHRVGVGNRTPVRTGVSNSHADPEA